MSTSINNDINNIFNQSFIKIFTNEITIVERDNQLTTTIKSIKFIFDGEIIKINQEQLILANFFIKIGKSKGLTSINDGVFIVNYKNQLYLNFCELKSELYQDKFRIAKTQIEATFLKVIIFLNILNKFSINDVIVNCFFVTNENTEIKGNSKKALDNGIIKDFVFNTLITKSKVKLLKDELELSKFPIKDDYLLSNVHLHLIEGNNREIYITDYFK